MQRSRTILRKEDQFRYEISPLVDRVKFELPGRSRDRVKFELHVIDTRKWTAETEAAMFACSQNHQSNK